MTEYKAKRIIDGKSPLRTVIVDEAGNVVNINPTKEELKGLEKEPRRSHDTRMRRAGYCNICGEKLVSGDAYREIDKDGKEAERWLCRKCWTKSDMKERYGSIANFRTGNLDPNCSTARGDDFEELTSIWKGVKILSKENDKCCGPLDHSTDSEGKIPQTKGRWYDSYNRVWGFGNLDREWEKDFDYEICYCASKDGKDIERMYEFPFKEEIKDRRRSITVYKHSLTDGRGKRLAWYEKYRIKDEEKLKKVNEIWKKIRKADKCGK